MDIFLGLTEEEARNLLKEKGLKAEFFCCEPHRLSNTDAEPRIIRVKQAEDGLELTLAFPSSKSSD